LRAETNIPVWHDDQQGTATVVLAGLINALKVVGKKIDEVRVAFIGAGASNVASARLAFAAGVQRELTIMVDSSGILNRQRRDIELRKAEYVDKWRLCESTNVDQREGGIREALEGADVCIALSKPGPDTLQKEWIAHMAGDAIVFLCANPIPEMWPWDAHEAGAAVVATGRSDFPNQVNNSLGFPGIFRGALDVRAKTITEGMCIAAAHALADQVGNRLSPEHILPTMDEWEVFPREAAAVGVKAQQDGVARLQVDEDELYLNAESMIRRARDMVREHQQRDFVIDPDQPVAHTYMEG
jgi:malate dehydrogenase (oxaloacetate-decarboxylating)